VEEVEGFENPGDPMNFRRLKRCALGLPLVIAGLQAPMAAQGSPQKEQQSGVPELYQQAEQEFNTGAYGEACRDFKRFAEQDASASSWSNYGVSCQLAGQTQDAIHALEQAVRLDPDLVPANLILGIEYVKSGRPSDAVPLFKAVLKQQPDNRDALIDLATAHFAMREFTSAADYFRRAIKFRPRDADAWYGMGTSFEHIAEESSRRLSAAPKGSAYFHRLVARSLLEQDLPLDAEAAFRQALADASNEEDLHAEMGFALLRAGQIEGADREFRNELSLHPHSQTGLFGLAGVNFANAKFREALQKVCALHRNDAGFFVTKLPLMLNSVPEDARVGMTEYLNHPENVTECASATNLLVAQLNGEPATGIGDQSFEPLAKATNLSSSKMILSRGRVASENGRYTECYRDLEAIPLTSPQDAVLLSRCASLAGFFVAAFEATQAASPQDVPAPGVLYWRAESARELAKVAFSNVLSLNPGSWQGQLLLGDLYRQRKKWDLAISNYSSALQIKPDSPAPHLGLAAIYWENGQFEKAQPELQMVLQLDPENVQAMSEFADILVRQHHFEEALPYLLKVADRDPELLLTHANLGKVYANLDKDSQAINELLLALPSDLEGELHYRLFRLYTKQGKTKEAREALAESERLRALSREQSRIRAQASTGGGDTAPPP
jgi:tetratricopeptide (TPR) repeat protein